MYPWKLEGVLIFVFLCELRRVQINQYRNPLGRGSHHFYKNSYYTFLWRGCFKAFVLICNMLKCIMSISLWLKTLLLKFPFNLFKLLKQDKTRVHPFLAPSIRGHRLPIHSSYLWACLYYVFVCFRFHVKERSHGLFLTFSLSIMLWRLQMLQIPIFYSFQGEIMFHCTYIPHLYPFIRWWAPRLFPYLLIQEFRTSFHLFASSLSLMSCSFQNTALSPRFWSSVFIHQSPQFSKHLYDHYFKFFIK